MEPPDVADLVPRTRREEAEATEPSAAEVDAAQDGPAAVVTVAEAALEEPAAVDTVAEAAPATEGTVDVPHPVVKDSAKCCNRKKTN